MVNDLSDGNALVVYAGNALLRNTPLNYGSCLNPGASLWYGGVLLAEKLIPDVAKAVRDKDSHVGAVIRLTRSLGSIAYGVGAAVSMLAEPSIREIPRMVMDLFFAIELYRESKGLALLRHDLGKAKLGLERKLTIHPDLTQSKAEPRDTPRRRS